MSGKYDSKFDPTNNLDPLSILNKEIVSDSTVLEFGPANGRFTKSLHNAKNCTVDIVEFDEKSGKDATKFARNSLIGLKDGNIENYKWELAYADYQYDYIVFADVLEHLRNPQKALEEASKLLKEQGKILLSIPNVAHNAVLMALIEDDFPYRPTGLLDNTHIHFFTKKTIAAMLNNIDLNIYKFSAIIVSPPSTEFHDNYARFPKIIADMFKLRPNGEAYQYVIVCGKEASYEKQDASSKTEEDFSAFFDYANKLADVTGQLMECQRKCETYENSHSWKITAPLRKLVEKWKNL